MLEVALEGGAGSTELVFAPMPIVDKPGVWHLTLWLLGAGQVSRGSYALVLGVTAPASPGRPASERLACPASVAFFAPVSTEPSQPAIPPQEAQHAQAADSWSGKYEAYYSESTIDAARAEDPAAGAPGIGVRDQTPLATRVITLEPAAGDGPGSNGTEFIDEDAGQASFVAKYRVLSEGLDAQALENHFSCELAPAEEGGAGVEAVEKFAYLDGETLWCYYALSGQGLRAAGTLAVQVAVRYEPPEDEVGRSPVELRQAPQVRRLAVA